MSLNDFFFNVESRDQSGQFVEMYLLCFPLTRKMMQKEISLLFFFPSLFYESWKLQVPLELFEDFPGSW